MEPTLSLPGMILCGMTMVLFCSVAFGLLLAGPTRWVKIATLALVLNTAATFALLLNPLVGLAIVAICLLTPPPLVMLSLTTWRTALRRVYVPPFRGTPPFAHKTLARWTHELGELGWQIHAARESTWRFMGRDSVFFVRFLTHPGEPFWIELHVMSNPRVLARILITDLGDGRGAATGDQQSDSELIDLGGGTYQRVPRRTTCAEMIDRHRAITLPNKEAFAATEDPVESSARLHDAWIDRIVAGGLAAEKEPGWVGIRFAKLPRVVLGVFGAWLH